MQKFRQKKSIQIKIITILGDSNSKRLRLVIIAQCQEHLVVKIRAIWALLWRTRYFLLSQYFWRLLENIRPGLKIKDKHCEIFKMHNIIIFGGVWIIEISRVRQNSEEILKNFFHPITLNLNFSEIIWWEFSQFPET